MPESPEPQWQPIHMLPTVRHHVEGMLEASKQQLALLRQATDRPYVLDDATLDPVVRSFRAQADDHWLWEEQVRRWKTLEGLSGTRRQQLEQLEQSVAEMVEANTAVLELAEELSKGTIDKVMAKSDLELGLEALMRGLPGDR